MPIFVNGAETTLDPQLSDTTTSLTPQQLADDFLLDPGDMVDTVRFIGAFAGGDTTPSDFRVRIYSNIFDSGIDKPHTTNLGGSPATFFSGPITGTVTGTDIGGIDLREYAVPIAFSPPIVGTTRFWLSIVEVSNPLSFFLARTTLSGSGLDPVRRRDADGGSFGTHTHGGADVELAFALDGESLSNVPEPSSLALLGIGACGFFGYGWRRRKRGTDMAA